MTVEKWAMFMCGLFTYYMYTSIGGEFPSRTVVAALMAIMFFVMANID